MENLKFTIQLNVKDLYYFMMYHYYHKLSGIFGVILSLAAAVMLIFRFSALDDTGRMLLLIIALLFTVINPILMFTKAKKQILLNKSLGGELTYMLDDDQLSICLNDEKAGISWEQIAKAQDNGRQLVIYVNAARGYIWPKHQIEDQYDAIIAVLKANVDAGRLRLKEKR